MSLGVGGQAQVHLRAGHELSYGCGGKQGCTGETAAESVRRGLGLTSHLPLLAFLSGWVLGSDCRHPEPITKLGQVQENGVGGGEEKPLSLPLCCGLSGRPPCPFALGLLRAPDWGGTQTPQTVVTRALKPQGWNRPWGSPPLWFSSRASRSFLRMGVSLGGLSARMQPRWWETKGSAGQKAQKQTLSLAGKGPEWSSQPRSTSSPPTLRMLGGCRTSV